MSVLEEKKVFIVEVEVKVDKYEKVYRRGLIFDEERYEKVIEIWIEIIDKVIDVFMGGLDRLNNIYIMVYLGVRGFKN